jgi:hypothetical protein
METLPPLTVHDLELAFQNPTFSTYLFVGPEADEGWENAEIAFGLITRLRIYRAERHDLLPDEWLGGGRPSGIAFDWNGNAVGHLDDVEARDLKLVIRTIRASRRP